MMELWLLRHGATRGNELRNYVGRGTDEPLSPKGSEQCARLGVYPQIERVYVSPLIRARQTAERCFPHAEMLVVPGLEEFDFGVFEGRNADQMVSDVAYRAWVDGGCMGRCPEGESREEFVRRSNEALVSLLIGAERRGEQSVIVVAHGGTIMAALHGLAQIPAPGDDYYGWHVDPCEGYRVTVRLAGESVQLEDPQRIATLLR